MIIALKGTIGTGKTTLAKEFEKKDYVIVNCDEIVHELYKEDQELIKEISNTFAIKPKKKGILSKKYQVDREALGKVVFHDQEKMKQLEAMVHPILKEKMQEIIDKNEKVIIDCQVVDKLQLKYDLAILLYADPKIIVERIEKRDQKDRKLIEKIISNQTKKEVLKQRTYAIDSSSGIDYVLEQVGKIKELKHD